MERPENLNVRNVLCLLEDRFRQDFGDRKPMYRIIVLLREATFPEGGKKTVEQIRAVIKDIRKRER